MVSLLNMIDDAVNLLLVCKRKRKHTFYFEVKNIFQEPMSLTWITQMRRNSTDYCALL